MKELINQPINATWVERAMPDAAAAPAPSLGFLSATAITIGIVVGAGIFRVPALVAANTNGEWQFIGAWTLGAAISLVGALCYAELASAYPSAGGDYYFLTRAFGLRPAFLFAWARMTVIQTGSIALLAYVFGDYASQLFNLGANSSVLYAAAAVALTGLNVAGVKQGARTQNLLTALEVGGVLLVALAGLIFAPAASDATAAASGAGSGTAAGSFGLAMVFVLLSYGGWNEAAYISGELRDARRRMAKVLLVSIAAIAGLYLLLNFAYLRTLGLAGVAGSEAVAADVMRLAFGDAGAWAISLLVAISALTSANATVITGARTNYAMGRDFPVFAVLGRWNGQTRTPTNALLAQGAIALLLVALGAWTREGFTAIVEYTAPVFWLFFLLVGISLFVLRRKDKNLERPARVPFYPVLPLVFCATSAYLLYASLAYTGAGALVGAAVLIIGALLQIAFVRPREENARQVSSGISNQVTEEN